MTVKKFFTILFLLAFPVILMMSCNSSSTTKNEENTSTGTSGDDSQRILEKEVFASAIKKSGAVLVDVRTPAEFEQGHIEDAININFFGPEFKYQLLDLNRKKKYYLYCKNETRSYRAMKFMEDNEFKEVYILKGGYQDWNTPATE